MVLRLRILYQYPVDPKDAPAFNPANVWIYTDHINVIYSNRLTQINDGQNTYEGNMYTSIITAVPADDIAPLGIRASAGTVMTLWDM